MFDWLKKSSPPASSAQPDSAKPSDSLACKERGDSLLDAGKFQEAAAAYREAIAVNPGYAEAYNNLANALREAGQSAEAEACLKQAISIKPELAFAHYNLGSLLQAQGRLSEAIDHFNTALELKPEVEPFYVDLFQALLQAGHIEDAKAVISKGLHLNPAFAEFHFLLASLFEQTRELDKAIDSYKKGLAIQPNSSAAYSNLGKVLFEQGMLNDAITCYNHALRIKPDDAIAHYNLGLAASASGNYSIAIEHFQKALAIQPDSPTITYGLGAALIGQKNNAEGIIYLRKTLELDPGDMVATMHLLHESQHMCAWDNFEEAVKTVRRAVLRHSASDRDHISPFIFLSLPGATAHEERLCAERWIQGGFQAFAALRKKIEFDFNPPRHEKIRIGYISADFRQHAVSFLMAEVFELHDRARFHVTAYSYGPDDGSVMRKRLENAVDDFQDIKDDSFEAAARKIHADQIDILIDLTGHTEHSRSGILALRPAPIQVNYLGYPGTMGADFIDYIIADQFTIPQEQRQHYTEKVVWMPDCFQANDRKRPRPTAPTRDECGLPAQGIVFCCFNHVYKFTPGLFDVWCRLLKAVPDSVLWLPASNSHVETNLRREAAQRGVTPERLRVAPFMRRDAHLARLQCADLFLDTLPFNAGTTCSDALWMGLPVVTCAGDAFASRMAGSLLNAIGAPELITYNLDDYFQLALELASNPDKLAAIRSKIIANRDTAPLFDSARFTRNLEQVLVQMIADNKTASIS